LVRVFGARRLALVRVHGLPMNAPFTGRSFSDDDKDEIRAHQRRAYRWTFLVSGLEHPNFVRIVAEVTDSGSDKIAATAETLSA
jgi:hypothetical protein